MDTVMKSITAITMDMTTHIHMSTATRMGITMSMSTATRTTITMNMSTATRMIIIMSMNISTTTHIMINMSISTATRMIITMSMSMITRTIMSMSTAIRMISLGDIKEKLYSSTVRIGMSGNFSSIVGKLILRVKYNNKNRVPCEGHPVFVVTEPFYCDFTLLRGFP